MNKNKRDLVIASILVVIFVVSFTQNVLLRNRKKPPPSPAAQEEVLAADAAVKNLVFVTNLRANDVVLKEQEKFWEGDFGRDPFMAEASLSERGDIQNLVLKGIFWDENNPKALVNDKMLSKGDAIMGYKVAEIHFKSVVFWTGEKSVELSLFQSAVSDNP